MMLTRKLGVALLTVGALLTGVPTPAISATIADPVLPTANAKWDYQIGKTYVPRDGVTVVSRDREARPAERRLQHLLRQRLPDAARNRSGGRSTTTELLLKNAKDGLHRRQLLG